MIDIDNNTVSLDLFKNVLNLIKDKPESSQDVIDSFSDNQFKSKTKVLDYIGKLNVVTKKSEVVIFGSWYGSILIPGLCDKVSRISCIDLDEQVLKIAKNRLFSHYNNVDYIASDVFDKKRHGRIMNADLIINPSCEHMPSMKTLDALKTSKAYFAFTSNNMYNIEGHINCVNSLEEFKDQMPEHAKVLFEDEIKDTRGIRYMLVGKFMPL